MTSPNQAKATHEPTDAALPLAPDAGERRGDMLYRPFGRATEKISLVGMGGFHLGLNSLTNEGAVKLIHRAIDRGVNFLDNSWDYNEGRSELRMGMALAASSWRDKVFLMTKIDGRSKEEAARQIDACLLRLRTDHIDLVQHHEIIRFDDADRIFREGGAQEALLDAKKAGKIRYIGFTGHKHPRIHLQMLHAAEEHGFLFDSVQMPVNVLDAHFRSFARLVLPYLVEHGIAALAMKTFGAGLSFNGKVPLTPRDMLHYSMSLATNVVITGMENDRDLDQALEAVKTFAPLDRAAIDALLAKSAPFADGHLELFKTSAEFDSTAKNAAWLGEESESVKKLMPVME